MMRQETSDLYDLVCHADRKSFHDGSQIHLELPGHVRYFGLVELCAQGHGLCQKYDLHTTKTYSKNEDSNKNRSVVLSVLVLSKVDKRIQWVETCRLHFQAPIDEWCMF